MNGSKKKQTEASGFKASCLEKMFAQKGEKRPRLRLAGFEGDWIIGSGKEIFEVTNDRGYPELPVLSATQDQGMVIRDDTVKTVSHNIENETTYKRVLPRQFVIHLRSFQGGFAHSRVAGITSPAYTIMKFKNESLHDDIFWKYVLTSKHFVRQLELITYGIRDGRSIGFSGFSELVFCFPDKKEQSAIGKFFEDLDKVIELQAKKVEKLRHIKTGCLERMFG